MVISSRYRVSDTGKTRERSKQEFILVHFAVEREAHTHRLKHEVRRLVDEFRLRGAELVILFGSLAKNKAGLFSDADLLVVMESDMEYLERSARLYGELKPWCADIFVYTPDEFERIRNHNPLVRAALVEGTILHEKQ